MGGTEEVILRIYTTFRRNDVEGVMRLWHEEGELKPLANSRTYRGHQELRRFYAEEIHESARSDFKVYTVLEQKQLALVFGRYRIREGEGVVEKGAFWIAEVEAGKLIAWQGFEHVGEAFTEFKQRLGSPF
jgi:ketosteroid isomerase-like protein